MGAPSADRTSLDMHPRRQYGARVIREATLTTPATTLERAGRRALAFLLITALVLTTALAAGRTYLQPRILRERTSCQLVSQGRITLVGSLGSTTMTSKR